MGFRTNCFTERTSRRAEAGIALMEYVMGVGVSAIALVVIAVVSLHTGRTVASLANYSEMQASSLNAIDQMTKELRQARTVTSYSTNTLVFLNATNASVTLTYSSADRTFTRTEGRVSKVLLSECEFVKFWVYERTPIAGTFNYNQVDDTNEAKVIFISWLCSRSLAGSKLNTDAAQTAKIVLRTN